jgi:sugar lactone lactonase YvrE
MSVDFRILALLALSMSLPNSGPTKIALNLPQGMAFDNHGNLYVANSGSNEVLVYNANLVQETTRTITAGLDDPNRLAFDGGGNLYVANGNSNSIAIYAEDNQRVVEKTITKGINSPLGVAVDAYGDVFVANNAANTVTAYNAAGDLVETLSRDRQGRAFAAPGALATNGTNLFVGTGPTVGENDVTSYNVGNFLTRTPIEVTTFTDDVNTGPTGIAFDRAGNVYVSDFYSSTATKYSPSGKLLQVIGSQTAQCEGIAVDKRGNIYVSNIFANTITVYDADGNLIDVIR